MKKKRIVNKHITVNIHEIFYTFNSLEGYFEHFKHLANQVERGLARPKASYYLAFAITAHRLFSKYLDFEHRMNPMFTYFDDLIRGRLNHMKKLLIFD